MEEKVGGEKRYTRNHLDGEQRYAKKRRTEKEENKGFMKKIEEKKKIPGKCSTPKEGRGCALGPSVAKSTPDVPRKFNTIMEMFKRLENKTEGRKPQQEKIKN